MKRTIDKALLDWKRDQSRKVLVLRGARQVGKTFSIRQLGKEFDNLCEINFELMPEAKALFENSRDPVELLPKLSAFTESSIVPGKTLLFLDEIQACPNALKALRFFHERMPALHVASAGSLLEFALEEIPSYGVGRVQSMFMYPLSFPEFLEAAGFAGLLSVMREASPEKPLDLPFHSRLMDKMKLFIILGGMPGVLGAFIETGDLIKARDIQGSILVSLTDDFAKYKGRSPSRRLTEVFRSIVGQAGGKFKYSAVSRESPHVIRQSLDLIVQAGLAYEVVHTHAHGIPLGAEVDRRRFKVVLFDTGLAMRLLGMPAADIIAAGDLELVNKGSMAEQFAGLEFIKAAPPADFPELFYWHRESPSSNAEVDYILGGGSELVPVEVKSGSRGQMQSLRLFMKERNISRGIRLAGENFGRCGNIDIYPLYAASILRV
jgi:predicted AAA+ superfamily ATPase